MAHSTSLPLVDWNSLQTLSDGDKAFETELLELFISDTRTHLAKLETALQQQDTDQVRRLAHHLKGSSANVGAMRFSDIAAALETEARQNSLQNGIELNQHLQSTFAEVEKLITDR